MIRKILSDMKCTVLFVKYIFLKNIHFEKKDLKNKKHNDVTFHDYFPGFHS